MKSKDCEAKKPLAFKAEKLMQVLAIVCGVAIVFNMILIICDVFMRYVFAAPILGATETASMMMMYVAYCGLGYTLLKGSHIQMNALYERNKGRYKHIADVIIYLVVVVVMVVLTYITWNSFFGSFMRMEKANVPTTVYLWIGKFGGILGCAGMLIQSVLVLLVSLKKAIKYPNADDEPTFKKAETQNY